MFVNKVDVTFNVTLTKTVKDLKTVKIFFDKYDMYTIIYIKP